MLLKAPPRLPKNELSFLEEVCSEILTFSNKNSLKVGVHVHSPIIKLGLRQNLFLVNNLLSLYAKCAGLHHARYLFDEMPQRDVFSWTVMMSASVKCGQHQQAMALFHSMKSSGQCPNEFTLSTVLKSCLALGEFEFGLKIQTHLIKLGFESNPVLGSNLIDLYSKFDRIEEAYKIFMRTENSDVVSWSQMISSFVRDKNFNRAFRIYTNMIEVGVHPNEYTFVNLLTACNFLGLKYGRLIHAHLIVWGIKLNLILKTALVEMYSNCQMIDDSLKVSSQTPEKDVFLWTTIISGLNHNSKFHDSISSFRKMLILGISPNNYTFSSILNACSSIQDLELGQQIHKMAILSGLDNDVSVGNALVDMYMKCSDEIGDGVFVFGSINSPNIVSWTSLISGLVFHGFEEESFRALDEMKSAGERPNSFTLVAVLRACGKTKSCVQTRKIHGFVLKTNGIDNLVLGNALVDAYSELGLFEDAWSLISMMNCIDVITYTIFATRINQAGLHERALNVINDMQNDEIKMDDFSLSSFLSASAGLGAIEPGRQLHCSSIKSGLIYVSISVSNGLIDMYGKCGLASDAKRAFAEIPKPDVVSWNGLIFGLASNGRISAALSTYEDMVLARIKPDSITLLLVLFACSHGGLVDSGLEYFDTMQEKHQIIPQLDHYVCLVDLLGRAGQLEKAIAVIETMPFKPDPLIYKTLLGACRLHKNISLGEDIARRGLELNPNDPALYVLVANMYDDSGLLDLGEKTRSTMRERGLKKNPGHSWMEVKNKVHSFKSGDKTHPLIKQIHEKIEFLRQEFEKRGFSYLTKNDSKHHSEKLAVGFGLIMNASSNAPIRVMKNLRICRDCHEFIANVTRLVVDREIIVRDGNRFHCFKNGECTCNGYW